MSSDSTPTEPKINAICQGRRREFLPRWRSSAVPTEYMLRLYHRPRRPATTGPNARLLQSKARRLNGR